MEEKFEEINPGGNLSEEPITEQPEQQEGQVVEMPEDFVEPEGKKGKWKTVKGEVEIEGKKVEVSYREKVIELPKHRQVETGIKRICRRELLPPFPEGLYISGKERKSQFLNDQWEYYSSSFKYGSMPSYDDPHKRYKENVEKLKENEQFPVYVYLRKFEDFYRFLTDNKYPANNIYCHTLDPMINAPNFGSPDRDKDNIELFKKEGLYFQEIYPIDNKAGKQQSRYGGGLWLRGLRMYENLYATPVFVFSERNEKFTEYLISVGVDVQKTFGELFHGNENELVVPVGGNSTQQKLYWCNADLALVPTRRSLNVLFFETDDEKTESEKEEQK